MAYWKLCRGHSQILYKKWCLLCFSKCTLISIS